MVDVVETRVETFGDLVLNYEAEVLRLMATGSRLLTEVPVVMRDDFGKFRFVNRDGSVTEEHAFYEEIGFDVDIPAPWPGDRRAIRDMASKIQQCASHYDGMVAKAGLDLGGDAVDLDRANFASYPFLVHHERVYEHNLDVPDWVQKIPVSDKVARAFGLPASVGVALRLSPTDGICLFAPRLPRVIHLGDLSECMPENAPAFRVRIDMSGAFRATHARAAQKVRLS